MGVSFCGLVATFARYALVDERGPDTREAVRPYLRTRSDFGLPDLLATEFQRASTLSGWANMSLFGTA